MTSLRKASESDAWLLVRWRNENARYFLDTGKLTLNGHRRWWANVYTADPWDHLYVAEHDGKPVGTIGLHLSDGEVRRVLLGEKALARTGVMSEALRLLTSAYGLPRYWLRVRRDNAAAAGFYHRNGFEVSASAGEWVVMER